MAEGPERFSSQVTDREAKGRSLSSSEIEAIDPDDLVEDRASVEDLADIEVELDDPTATLLTLTGENWSIDAQRETLKEAAKENATPAKQPEPATVKPALPIPTPFDFGGASTDEHPALILEEEVVPSTPVRAPQRTIPPPLPASPGGSVPPPRTQPPPAPPSKASGSVRPAPSQPPTSRRPPPPPSKTESTPSRPPVAVEPPRVLPEGAALVDLLSTRIERLASGGDPVGLARAHVELAIVQETYGDDTKVDVELEAALGAAPGLASAHSILRRRIHHRTRLPGMREHLAKEIELSANDTTVVELIAERARLFAASEMADDARTSWELVLARVPHHPAALKGLETDLQRRTIEAAATSDRRLTFTTDEERWDDLVAHLATLADAYAAQPDLAAWIHVERAHILELRLGRVDAARGAFERALRLDDRSFAVRDAFVLHCAAHHDTARLADLLADEARFERSPARAARLELDAACLVDALGGDEARTAALLERAAARAPTTPDVDRRTLDELVRIYETAGKWLEGARARRARLPFFTDAASQVYELKRLAALEERLGNLHAAIRDVERAAEIDPEDITLAPELDRLLSLVSDHSARVRLWHDLAQREQDGLKRARLLAKAARIAEVNGGRDEAVRLLRTAIVAAPSDSEVVDQLSRLMSTPRGDAHEVRALIELYSQAAQATRDIGRRVAYLEKVALLWEEAALDQVRAARTFEEILRIEPTRRGAVLGLGRTAARIGDERALARALAEEAKLAEDGATVLALRVRSAEALSRVDPARAANVVGEVLATDPEHVAARALETRLHAEAGRWELAAQSLKTRLSHAVTTKDKVSIWLELAQICDARLRDPKAAAEALQAARKADPIHPVPPEEIARVLAAAGDAKALRAAVEQLAEDAITPQERARHLIVAAEIDELRLGDDESAAKLYVRALSETPESELVAERLQRVLARRVVTTAKGKGPAAFETTAWTELLGHIGKIVKGASGTSKERTAALAFQLASLLTVEGRDLAQAKAVLENAFEAETTHGSVLRLRELLARRAHQPQQLASVLKQQGESLADIRARLGALWELVALESWTLPSGESLATYTRILELDSTDPSALAAVVRLALGAVRRRDVAARRATISALRALAALAHDDSTRIATSLRLGLILDAHATDPAAERETMAAASRESLERLRDALALDPLSVTAATSLARVANRLGDTAGAVAAATSLAELAVLPRVRARYLLDASKLLLSDATDEALGARADRTERAAAYLESAILSDPNTTSAAGLLAHVRTQQGASERLVDVFRTALASATAKDAIIFVGTELARVAQDDLDDVSIAIDAMRAVRSAAPDHVPSLLSLSELFIAQRAWAEAVEVLQDVVRRGRDVPARITALFALASIYEKVLAQPEEAERSLRSALGIQPDSARAIRALVHRLVAKQTEAGADPRPQAKVAAKLEIASLLDRLTHVETDPLVKCDVLLELADMRVALEDIPLAERALIEAVAVAPAHGRAFARLARFYRTPAGPDTPATLDVVGYARALGGVIARGKELRTTDARWYAALGRIEVEQLNRVREGTQHLQAALDIDPTLHQCRFELATAFSRIGAHEEAAKAALGLITPDASPLGAIGDTGAALDVIERSLGAARQPEQAIVISELRAIAGTLDEGRHAWLRGRRLLPFDSHHSALDRSTLVSQTVPIEGRTALLEVAGAIAGIETKILRADAAELGISSRDRIGKRSGHPTRALLDRLAKSLGVTDVELVVTPNVNRMRVIAQDNLWVVVPKSLTELPEPTQSAALGRALARVALGVPWLEEIPPTHIEAMLLAAARSVSPSFGGTDVDVLTVKLATQYEPNIVRELSRKQRQALERVVAATSSQPLVGIDTLIHALARAELRIAYAATGDLLATVDELRSVDPAFFKSTDGAGKSSLMAVLHHPFAGDVVRFALGPEATALRKRVGSTWTA